MMRGQHAQESNGQGEKDALVQVDPETLAVLPAGFSRELGDPWSKTKVPQNEANKTVGDDNNICNATFLSFTPRFATILGQNPKLEVLAERDYEFAHEGPVYLPQSNEVFFTSNRLSDHCVELNAVDLTSGEVRTIKTSKPVPLANGAVDYKHGVALLAQGHKDGCPGGVLFLDPYTGEWDWVINNWFGLQFNSPNDIVTTSDGAIWFTDPSYGATQGFKNSPQLGEFVWRYMPGGPPARVVADGFQRPNGLSLTADQKIMYVSDTGMASGASDAPPDPMQPHTIYAFDISEANGGHFLTNRRVFAVADNGIPDGVKCDRDGNVYSGCGDGLNVWASSGDLIGKIMVDGGVANFVFAGNDLIMLAETRVLKLRLLCKGNCK
jgi:gluconolactonase